MGAIGLARVFTYGGRFGHPIYDPSIPARLKLSKEEYMNSNSTNTTAINHLYEKILSLKDKMKTETGRKFAINRHQYVENFIKEFLKEWEGEL